MGDLPTDRERVCSRIVQSIVSGQPTTIADAASRLRTFCSEREHVFWPDSFSIRERKSVENQDFQIRIWRSALLLRFRSAVVSYVPRLSSKAFTWMCCNFGGVGW
jgi:hypothetical protein